MFKKIGKIIKLIFALIVAIIIAFIILAGGTFVVTKFFSAGGEVTTSAENKEERLNVLLLGTDSDNTRTDFIMLANYDPATGRVILLSIPRDTRVNTLRTDSKINSAYIKGHETVLLDEIEQITGIRPQYYLVVDLKGFRNIIDSLGGIKFDVPIDMKYDDPLQNLHIHLTKGVQILDGAKAEQFVRFRMNNDGTGYVNGDIDRIKVQQKFIMAAVEQVLKPSNLLKIPQMIKIVTENVNTNIAASEIAKYARSALLLRKENIRFITLPGESKYIGGISYYLYNSNKTKTIIQNYFVLSAHNEESAGEDDFKFSLGQVGGENQQGTATGYLGSVEVLNATDITGLANKVAKRLSDEGYSIKKVGNYYTQRHIATKIIEKSDLVDGRDIAKILRCGVVSNESDIDYGVDITVIIGADYRE